MQRVVFLGEGSYTNDNKSWLASLVEVEDTQAVVSVVPKANTKVKADTKVDKATTATATKTTASTSATTTTTTAAPSDSYKNGTVVFSDGKYYRFSNGQWHRMQSYGEFKSIPDDSLVVATVSGDIATTTTDDERHILSNDSNDWVAHLDKASTPHIQTTVAQGHHGEVEWAVRRFPKHAVVCRVLSEHVVSMFTDKKTNTFQMSGEALARDPDSDNLWEYVVEQLPENYEKIITVISGTRVRALLNSDQRALLGEFPSSDSSSALGALWVGRGPQRLRSDKEKVSNHKPRNRWGYLMSAPKRTADEIADKLQRGVRFRPLTAEEKMLFDIDRMNSPEWFYDWETIRRPYVTDPAFRRRCVPYKLTRDIYVLELLNVYNLNQSQAWLSTNQKQFVLSVFTGLCRFPPQLKSLKHYNRTATLNPFVDKEHLHGAKTSHKSQIFAIGSDKPQAKLLDTLPKSLVETEIATLNEHKPNKRIAVLTDVYTTDTTFHQKRNVAFELANFLRDALHRLPVDGWVLPRTFSAYPKKPKIKMTDETDSEPDKKDAKGGDDNIKSDIYPGHLMVSFPNSCLVPVLTQSHSPSWYFESIRKFPSAFGAPFAFKSTDRLPKCNFYYADDDENEEVVTDTKKRPSSSKKKDIIKSGLSLQQQALMYLANYPEPLSADQVQLLIPVFMQWANASEAKYLELKTSRIPGAGQGVFAKEDIPSGVVVVQYKGNLYTEKQLDAKYGKDELAPFAVKLHSGLYIDAKDFTDPKSPKYSLARYINDCKISTAETLAKLGFPNQSNNCAFVELGNSHMFVVTAAAIPKGDELYVNYESEYWKGEDESSINVASPPTAASGT